MESNLIKGLKMNTRVILISLVITGAFLLSTGWTDADWQLVSYRYNEWHRSIAYWEYNPYLQIPWWIAWQLNLLRIILGTGMLTIVIMEIWRNKRNLSHE